MQNIKQKAREKPYDLITRNEYLSIHNWIRQNYGRANSCSSKKCSKQSTMYQWALKKGKMYCKNISHYKMLCRICHSKYDMTKETKLKISKAMKGRKLLPESLEYRFKPVIQLSSDENIIKKYKSIKEASFQTGISISSISSCLVGRYKRTKDMKNHKIYYKWRYEK